MSLETVLDNYHKRATIPLRNTTFSQRKRGPFEIRRLTRRFSRIERGLCPKCGYPMGESAVCTECGKTLPRRARVAT